MQLCIYSHAGLCGVYVQGLMLKAPEVHPLVEFMQHCVYSRVRLCGVCTSHDILLYPQHQQCTNVHVDVSGAKAKCTPC